MTAFSWVKRKVFRYWYYFRIGYATYLVLPLGLGSTIVTIYYLFIKAVPDLQKIFPNFWAFVFVCIVVWAPSSVFLGILHFKRTRAYASEVDIAVESNPYNFKLPPGFNRTVFAPMFLQLVKQMRKIGTVQGTLSPEDETQMKQLEVLLEKLQKGGVVL